MTDESTIKLTISLADPELDEEELDELTRHVLRDIKDLVEDASMAEDEETLESVHRGGLATTLLGVLNAEVSIANLKKFLGFLGDRLGNKPIKISGKKPDGTEFSLEASSREELQQAAQELIDLMKKI